MNTYNNASVSIPGIVIITVGGFLIPLHFLVGLAVFCFGLILLLPLPLVIYKMKTFLIEEDCECCCCSSAIASGEFGSFLSKSRSECFSRRDASNDKIVK